MADPFELQRFVDAQNGTYIRALEELWRGRKEGHWMWFVFPQLKGLGSSPMAQHYAIGSLAEARAYLAHPVLGARLREAAAAVNATQGRTAREIFGPTDDLKFRSSMTLFHEAAPAEAVFAEALSRFYGGEPDPRTLELLRA